MTWIKSSLQRPDGTPLEGVCVTATLHAQPGWRADRTGQVLGRTTTHTDANGLWRLNLVPYTTFEPTISPSVYYTVDEGRKPVSFIRVPPVEDPDTELWMRDVLVAPPLPSPEPWSPIDTLGHLQNVDASVDNAADGAVLMDCGGTWIAAPLNLPQLGDVDQDSLDGAQPGDVLQLLPSGQWGVNHVIPATLTFVFTPVEPDFNPEEYKLSILTRDPTKTVHVEWGDGDGEDIPLEHDYEEHVYPDCGTYYPEVSYTDRSEVHKDFVTIPCEEILPMSEPVLTFQPYPSKARSMFVRYDNYTERHVISFGNGKTMIRNGGETAIGEYDAAGWYRVEAWNIGMTELLAGIQVRVMDDINPTFGTFGPDPDNADFFQIVFADDRTGIANKVLIDWGDGQPETVWAIPGQPVTRDLPRGGRDITITDLGSLRKSTTNVTVTGRVGDPDAEIILDPADKTNMTVKVTLEGVDAKKGAITVWWDQGVSEKIDKPAVGNEKTHKYTKPGNYAVVVEYSNGSSGDNGSFELITVGAT